MNEMVVGVTQTAAVFFSLLTPTWLVRRFSELSLHSYISRFNVLVKFIIVRLQGTILHGGS